MDVGARIDHLHNEQYEKRQQESQFSFMNQNAQSQANEGSALAKEMDNQDGRP